MGTNNTNFAVFKFVHGDDASLTYAALTSDPALIDAVRAELSKPFETRHLHIHGAVAKGDGGHNNSWHWHFVPDGALRRKTNRHRGRCRQMGYRHWRLLSMVFTGTP